MDCQEWYIFYPNFQYSSSTTTHCFYRILESKKKLIFQFFQNGTFKPVHEIWIFFWPEVFLWSIMKMSIRKNIHNMPQGLPNPGFMQEKVQKGDFLKKPSWELKFFCCFRFLWISRRSGTLNWKWLVFLLSKILYKKCVSFSKKTSQAKFHNSFLMKRCGEQQSLQKIYNPCPCYCLSIFEFYPRQFRHSGVIYGYFFLSIFIGNLLCCWNPLYSPVHKCSPKT